MKSKTVSAVLRDLRNQGDFKASTVADMIEAMQDNGSKKSDIAEEVKDMGVWGKYAAAELSGRPVRSEPYIWLQDNEDHGLTDSGIMLVRDYSNSGNPAVILSDRLLALIGGKPQKPGKILVMVSGGCVTGIRSTKTDNPPEVMVADFDNIPSDKHDKAQAESEKAYPVAIDESHADPTEL